MPPTFTLRPMRPADSASVADLLADEASSNSALGITTYYQIDTYQALMAYHPEVLGVVAEQEGSSGLAGMATVAFGQAMFEGILLPYAYLANLKVHPDFRRRGLGARLAQWRVEQARERFGDQGVIWTGMERSNDASRATATKWCREFREPIQLAITSTRARAPRPLKGVTVRPAEPREFAEIAEKQNAFYEHFNLYPPQTAGSLAQWLNQTPVDVPINHYYVAVTAAGEILAGAGITEQRRIFVDTFNNVPPMLRLINRVARIIPADYVLKHLPVTTLWYQPGQLGAGKQVWESLRWKCRALGSTLSSSYDPRGPLADIFPPSPWYQPRIELAIAVHGPGPMDPERFIYVAGR